MMEQFLNYTLARAALSYFTTDRRNFFYNMLYMPTEPAYRLYRKFLPCCHTLAIVITLLLLRYAVIKLL